jgi:hypothetical protein
MLVSIADWPPPNNDDLATDLFDIKKQAGIHFLLLAVLEQDRRHSLRLGELPPDISGVGRKRTASPLRK